MDAPLVEVSSSCCIRTKGLSQDAQFRAKSFGVRCVKLCKADLSRYDLSANGVQSSAPRRLSSVVEHFHGKEGVSGSSPEDGSTVLIKSGKIN